MKYNLKVDYFCDIHECGPLCFDNHIDQKEGDIAFMCPICYHIYRARVRAKQYVFLRQTSVSENYADVVVSSPELHFRIDKCPECEGRDLDLIVLDPNIADIISALNKKGYFTEYCCEGHGTCDPYIYFKNLDLYDLFSLNLPLSWYIDNLDLKENCLVIRADRSNWEAALEELQEWVDSLPDISDVYKLSDALNNLSKGIKNTADNIITAVKGIRK